MLESLAYNTLREENTIFALLSTLHSQEQGVANLDDTIYILRG